VKCSRNEEYSKGRGGQGQLQTKGVSEARGMGWNTIGEFANMGQIHLRTHLEEPEFQGCNKRSQDQDVSAPEIDPASLS
jgi:hypothetical protein